MERFYPASLRPQGVEIVRTWAFYTIYRSGVALTGMKPWDTILLNGNVLSPDGKKMSKSLGNIISPAELLRDYPTDAIRQWAALSGAMAKDRPFSYEDIKHAKSFLAKVWNAARFVENVLKDEILAEAEEEPELTVIDRWITGRLNATIRQCTEHMERFEFHYAMSKLQAFFWGDFCDNYLEYVKHRVYDNEGAPGEGRAAAVHTLRKVLDNSVRLLAPFAPHMAEELNCELFGRKGSIHHASWPEAGPEYAEEVAKVAVLNSVISELRQHKAKNRLAQNAELAKVRLSLPESMDAGLLSELQRISKIKAVETVTGEFSVSVL
jgi:valyl-tRNA synthetase